MGGREGGRERGSMPEFAACGATAVFVQVRDIVDWAWDKSTAKGRAVADLGTTVLVQAGDDVPRLL
jgi:hypothetical protein